MAWKGPGREGLRKLEPGLPDVVDVYYANVGSRPQTMLTPLI